VFTKAEAFQTLYELDHKHNKRFCTLTVTNMATARNFDVASDNCNKVRILVVADITSMKRKVPLDSILNPTYVG
jgi:hypothetical protein